MENIIKRIKKAVLPLAGFAFISVACSESDKAVVGTDDELIFDRVSLMVGNPQSALPAATRATGFVVNTDDDPTASLDDKELWTLDLTILKGGAPYAEGHGIFQYNDPYWESKTGQVYMPHYLIQHVTATLYPDSWPAGGNTIVTDQRNRTAFIEQDILEQNGTPTFDTVPAHYLAVEMRHSHSMIDFVLADINADDIALVTVEAGGLTYEPYKVAGLDREEYMVILPLGISYPVIRVRTKAGADYSKELDIDGTVINTCYHVRLVGLELVLEGLTVSNWAYGEAVDGNYSSPTSYPTFRGPAGLDLTVEYLSGTSQTMTFNEKGEAVEQPAGRTITAISSSAGRYEFPSPYFTIRTQIIDLNPYIALIGT